jgi:hypothetical protein
MLASFEHRSWEPNVPPPTDVYLPAWTQMTPRFPLLFRQPRGAMAEVFSALAFWNDNKVVVSHLFS